MRYDHKLCIAGACLLAVMLQLPALGSANDEMREWTSSEGANVTAKFVGQMGYLVVLQDEEGNRIQILMNNLSDDDQEYLKGLSTQEPANQPTIPRRTARAADRIILTEQEIAGLVGRHPEEPADGEKFVVFTSSVRSQNPSTAQRSRGRIPFRVISDLMEHTPSGNQTRRRRLSGTVRIYVLNDKGEMVDSASRTVAQMCPG